MKSRGEALCSSHNTFIPFTGHAQHHAPSHQLTVVFRCTYHTIPPTGNPRSFPPDTTHANRLDLLNLSRRRWTRPQPHTAILHALTRDGNTQHTPHATLPAVNAASEAQYHHRDRTAAHHNRHIVPLSSPSGSPLTQRDHVPPHLAVRPGHFSTRSDHQAHVGHGRAWIVGGNTNHCAARRLLRQLRL